MMDGSFKGLCAKLLGKYREQILYVAFGVMTTLVNFAVYYPLLWLGLDYVACNAIAWVVAVAFAYATNRKYVFISKAGGIAAILLEITSFFGFRLLSLGVETGMMLVGVEWMGISRKLIKLITQLVVTVLNYVFSKLWVFKPSGGKQSWLCDWWRRL